MAEEIHTPIDSEMIAFNIIANSGDARSHAYEALIEAKKGNFEKAEECLAKAKESSTEAHKAQTELLFAEANGNGPTMGVLLVHAQDHYMTSMLAEELIREIIELHKKIQ